MNHVIFLQREVTSGNVLAYRHWRHRTADRNYWQALFLACSSHVPLATGRRKVTVTAYRKRRVDEDNLSSGLKHGRDAMVRAGLLLDDDKKSCVFVYNECQLLSDLPPSLITRFGRKPLTVFNIEDL